MASPGLASCSGRQSQAAPSGRAWCSCRRMAQLPRRRGRVVLAAVLDDGGAQRVQPKQQLLVAEVEDGALSSCDTPTLSSSDGEEMCFFAQEAGDVQLVCASDPTHPVSAAEQAVVHPFIPTTILQDIEHKLEADLSTIAVTIVFAVAFIMLEFGVEDLLGHYFGPSVLGSIACIVIGLAVVFWVRLSKLRLYKLWRM